jgi:hypothetical protein
MKKDINKIYNINDITFKYHDKCLKTINDEIDVNFKRGLNDVIINILINFYDYKYEEGFLYILTPENDVKNATIDDVKVDMNNFIEYNVKKEGELSIKDDILVYSKNMVIDSYYDHNITPLGIYLWLIEKIGTPITCVIVKTDNNMRDFFVIGYGESFVETLDLFEDIIHEKDIDKKHCKKDYCKTGIKQDILYIILPDED